MIATLDQLLAELGDRFVILFGSAVSGRGFPRLPMIGDFKNELLTAAAVSLEQGRLWQRLLAAYARALGASGHYRGVLDTTKFETYLLRLTQTVDKPRVDELLWRIYVCAEQEYGQNQSAIAFLLKERCCLAALTTNFDNTLELCLPDLTVLDHTSRPEALPSTAEPPWLLKLHGDARALTCVATSDELSQARLRDKYAYLRDLLHDQRVLVLGYSGFGDVDIAPNLWQLDARLIWGNHEPVPHDHRYRNRVDLLCNLQHTLPTQGNEPNQNLLLQLAAHYGWTPQQEGKDHEWRPAVRAWVEQLSRDELSDFALSMHSWRTNWPSVHVSYYRRRDSDKPEDRFRFHESEVQISAYRSAERGLRRLAQLAGAPRRVQIEAQANLGFVLWREGRYASALKTLGPLADPAKQALELESLGLGEIAQHAARHYLETIDEMMCYAPRLEDRLQIYRRWNVEAIVNYLRGISKRLIEDEYLARIAILRIEHHVTQSVPVAKVRELLDEATAMEEWPSAALTVQLLLLQSGGRATEEMELVNEKLAARGNRTLIRKNKAFARHARLGAKYPAVLKLYGGRWLMLPYVVRTEITYARHRARWRRDYKLGRFQPVNMV